MSLEAFGGIAADILRDLPGFNDAHVHFLSGGFSLTNLDLRDAPSPEVLVQRLRDYAAPLPVGVWILGGDWGHERWPGAPLRTRQMIDDAAAGHPVLINRLDGHVALAKSAALRLAGIGPETEDSPGGLIVRDPAMGTPTGILKDSAMALGERVVRTVMDGGIVA